MRFWFPGPDVLYLTKIKGGTDITSHWPGHHPSFRCCIHFVSLGNQFRAISLFVVVECMACFDGRPSVVICRFPVRWFIYEILLGFLAYFSVICFIFFSPPMETIFYAEFYFSSVFPRNKTFSKRLSEQVYNKKKVKQYTIVVLN